MDPVHLALIVAAYGAALSTLVFGWNLFRDVSDRGRLRVEAGLRKILPEPIDPREQGPQVVLRITNVGRRPVWITNVGGLRYPEGGFVLVARNQLPMKLEPGQLIDELASVTEFENPEGILFFSVSDSTGRDYRTSRRNTKDIRAEVITELGSKPTRGVWRGVTRFLAAEWRFRRTR